MRNQPPRKEPHGIDCEGEEKPPCLETIERFCVERLNEQRWLVETVFRRERGESTIQ